MTVYEVGIEPEAGSYVLTGPDYNGGIPAGLTEIKMPLSTMFIIVRADKYSSSGQDQSKAADKFRKALTTQTLSDFKDGETPESTLILPVETFALPFKSTADAMTKYTPIAFLKMLQTSVHSSITPKLSKANQKLSDKFDSLFVDGNVDLVEKLKFAAGVTAAKEAIVNRYLNTRGSTNWTHFDNIGDWGKNVIDRSAIAEYCLYANIISTAAYYHAFYDRGGKALNGTRKNGYVLNIPKRKIPDVSRFWSLTAYTPNSIELVSNSADKYVVASYTPNLKYNADGSLTIYLARKKPSGAPKANRLPIPKGQFNVMLRLYGPEGDVSSYLPPAIRKN